MFHEHDDPMRFCMYASYPFETQQDIAAVPLRGRRAITLSPAACRPEPQRGVM